MFTSIRKLTVVAGAVVALAVGSTPTSALPLLNGSLPLAGLTITQNAANLGLSTLINAAGTITSGPGLDDYSPVPILTPFGPTALDLTNLLSFTMSNAFYGSFATTSGFIVSQSASFLDVYLEGVFTPGAGIPGALPSATSLRISLNQSGKSVSQAITLNSPPTIPEPAAMALVGSGLAGLAFVLGRRRNRA